MHCERIDEYLNKRRIEAEEKKRKDKEGFDLKSSENNADKDDKEIGKTQNNNLFFLIFRILE